MNKLRFRIGKKAVVDKALIGLLIAVMIGVTVSFQVVQEQAILSTKIYDQTNHTANLTTSNTTALACFGGDSCIVLNNANLYLYNSSDCATGAFTRNTDYTLYNNGTTPTANLTNTGRLKTPEWVCLKYQFRSPQYATGASVRTIIKLLPLMIAVVLLAILAAAAK